MNPRNNASGGPIISVRAYPIDHATKILAGQVVKLSGGKIVAAAAAETGAILGVANENHLAADDALNPRATGKEILVADGPEMLFECGAPVVEATGGSATTVVTSGLAAFDATDMQGGYLQLVKYGADSSNLDGIKTVKEIIDFGSGTFTVPAGGTNSKGDQFRVYPPVGFAGGNLSADGTGLVLTATAELSFQVVGHDYERGKIILKAKKHALGTE